MAEHHRFSRMFVDFEVEVVDPVALRATFLPDHIEVNGEAFEGMADTPDEALLSMAVTPVLIEALSNIEESTGLRLVVNGMTGPLPRARDEDGNYTPMRWSGQSGRDQDGELVDPTRNVESIAHGDVDPPQPR